MNLSIVVPILNEAPILPALITHLQFFKNKGCEVIVVDGGSSDNSASMIEAAGLKLIASEPGRGRQMNAGAALASAELLVFLHADTRLPPDAPALIRRAIEQQKYQWGRFDVVIQGRSRLLRLVAFAMNWRSALTGIATGDQAIFICRGLFAQLGGFAEQPLMEDIELCKQLKAYAKPARVRTPVITSGRRWETRGLWRTIFLMWCLRWRYWRGASAQALAEAYR